MAAYSTTRRQVDLMDSQGVGVNTQSIITSLSLLFILAGCSSSPPQPVLYPNAYYNQVGKQMADRDIGECKALAHSSGVRENKDGEIGKNAAGGAAVGGAAAGAWGLVRGGDALERAAAGAAAGGAAGATRGAIKSTETSPVFKNFVQKCLRDRGYEVIGWQ